MKENKSFFKWVVNFFICRISDTPSAWKFKAMIRKLKRVHVHVTKVTVIIYVHYITQCIVLWCSPPSNLVPSELQVSVPQLVSWKKVYTQLIEIKKLQWREVTCTYMYTPTAKHSWDNCTQSCNKHMYQRAYMCVIVQKKLAILASTCTCACIWAEHTKTKKRVHVHSMQHYIRRTGRLITT